MFLDGLALTLHRHPLPLHWLVVLAEQPNDLICLALALFDDPFSFPSLAYCTVLILFQLCLFGSARPCTLVCEFDSGVCLTVHACLRRYFWDRSWKRASYTSSREASLHEPPKFEFTTTTSPLTTNVVPVANDSASDHDALQSGALASLTRARESSRAGYATS